MKQLEVRIPHGLSVEEVHRRLDRALEKARAEYGEQVGPIIVSEAIGKGVDAEKVFMRLAAKAAAQLKPKVRSD